MASATPRPRRGPPAPSSGWGPSAVAFEDLVLPARLGRPPAVDSQAVIEGKLRAALEARSSEDFKIIGRTDAAYAVGLDEALKRASGYAGLGVDAIIAPGLPDLDAYKRLREAVSVPIIAIVAPGGFWFAPSVEDLVAVGIEAIIFPVSVLTRVVKATQEGLARLKDFDGSPAEGFEMSLLGAICRAGEWAAIDGQQPQ